MVVVGDGDVGPRGKGEEDKNPGRSFLLLAHHTIGRPDNLIGPSDIFSRDSGLGSVKFKTAQAFPIAHFSHYFIPQPAAPLIKFIINRSYTGSN